MDDYNTCLLGFLEPNLKSKNQQNTRIISDLKRKKQNSKTFVNDFSVHSSGIKIPVQKMPDEFTQINSSIWNYDLEQYKQRAEDRPLKSTRMTLDPISSIHSQTQLKNYLSKREESLEKMSKNRYNEVLKRAINNNSLSNKRSSIRMPHTLKS